MGSRPRGLGSSTLLGGSWVVISRVFRGLLRDLFKGLYKGSIRGGSWVVIIYK